MSVGTVLLVLFVIAFLAVVAVFLRIGFSVKLERRGLMSGHPGPASSGRRPPPPPESPALIPPRSESDEVADFIEYGMAQSEVGLAWAALCGVIEDAQLKNEWGSGMLALEIQKKLKEARAGGGAADAT